jgi:hypothetical membrane protein
MDYLLFLLGLLLVVCSLVYVLITLTKNKFGKKTFIALILSGVTLMLIGLLMPDTATETTSAAISERPAYE